MVPCNFIKCVAHAAKIKRDPAQLTFLKEGEKLANVNEANMVPTFI